MTLGLFKTEGRDFAGFKLLHADDMSFLDLGGSTWLLALLVLLPSMKALIGGFLTLDLLRGPWHSISAGLNSMFFASAKREMVYLVITTYSWFQSDARGQKRSLS